MKHREKYSDELIVGTVVERELFYADDTNWRDVRELYVIMRPFISVCKGRNLKVNADTSKMLVFGKDYLEFEIW